MLNGHVIGLLKEYMADLVEQARQEAQARAPFGFSETPYRSDEALSDLLGLLDDRIESEGVQVGLPEGLLHNMWMLCNDAQHHVRDRVWMQTSVEPGPPSKARIRELTYHALIEFVDVRSG